MKPAIFGLCAAAIFVLVLAALLALALPVLAQAEPQNDCGPAKVVDEILAQYKEREIARGPTLHGALVRIYASPEGKTWTLVVSLPEGISCVVEVGKSWESVVGAEGSL